MSTITIHPAWVRRWGHATATILGSMLEIEPDEDGWFTATYTHLDRTLNVWPTTFIAARKRLTDDGVLETAAGVNINRYRIDRDRLRQLEGEQS